MSESKFPAGWDDARVKRLVDDYDSLTENELIAEDEAASAPRAGQVLVTVPEELMPAIRQLLATHEKSQGS